MEEDSIRKELDIIVEEERIANTCPTMTIREMGKLLGLGKTDSYWLANKHFFKIIRIRDKQRVDKASFEKWYRNQVKYQKIDGSPPGEELREWSYSVSEISKMIGITEGETYVRLVKDNVPFITVDYLKRITKKDFEEWYKRQDRYCVGEKDIAARNEIIERTISLPEMAKILRIERRSVYSIVRKYQAEFEIIKVGDHRRITKDSFERWYMKQPKYKAKRKNALDELPLSRKKEAVEKAKDNNAASIDSSMITPTMAAKMAGISIDRIYRLIREKQIVAIYAGKKVRIPKKQFERWLKEVKDGIDN